MSSDKQDSPSRPRTDPEELYVVELDERLEFGAAIIDSDLEADDNTNCHNGTGCTGTNHQSCTNDSC